MSAVSATMLSWSIASIRPGSSRTNAPTSPNPALLMSTSTRSPRASKLACELARRAGNAQILWHHRCNCTAGAQLGRERFELWCAPRREHDIVLVTHQLAGERRADAARCSGHEREIA